MTNLTLISFAVKNKYEAMEQVRDSNWNALREALIITEVILRKEKQRKRNWKSEILDLMKEKII